MQGSARIDELRQKFHENPRRYFAPLANEYRKAGDPEQAIAICRAHLAQQPAHMSGHVVYGQALYDANRIDESRTVFEKALSLDPDNAIVLRQLGDIARQRGETAEAKHWYGRALDTDPHNSEIAAYIAELTEPLTESADFSAASPSAAGKGTTSPAVATDVAVSTEGERIDLVEAPAAQSAAAASDQEATISPEQVEAVSTDEEVTVSSEQVVTASSDDEATASLEHMTTASVDQPVDTAPPTDQPVDTAPPTDEREPEPPSEEEHAERATSDTPVATPIVPLADVAWRKTPPHEDSPFVTRTMAELYAKQGYHAAALDVYRKLAITNPDDQDIQSRIRELSGAADTADSPAEIESAADVAQESALPSDAAIETPASDASEQSLPVPDEDEDEDEAAAAAVGAAVTANGDTSSVADESSSETAQRAEDQQSDSARAEQQPSTPAVEWTDDEVYTPAVQEIEPEPEPAPASESRHFTEMELAPGDAWDTDTWGAGFSGDESTDLELDVPDTPIVNLSAVPADANDTQRQEASSIDDAAVAEERGTAAPEAAAASDAEAPIAADTLAEMEPAYIAEPEVAVAEAASAEAESSTSVPQAANEDFVEAERFVAAEEESITAEENRLADSAASAVPETIAEPAPVPESDAAEQEESEVVGESESQREDEPHLVAYSPQPPDDEDLAHYEPTGPTVREFFATLGARRPPSPESAQSFTARAAVPSYESPSYESPSNETTSQEIPSDYPLAASAFADLFPDSPVHEEDTRAAFALSGAMSGAPSGPENPTAAETKRNTPSSPASPVDNTQESEEDIRRFREWLDGLAES